ncbi:unnamed protein product, partial [Nesidiocoris tenuis]
MSRSIKKKLNRLSQSVHEKIRRNFRQFFFPLPQVSLNFLRLKKQCFLCCDFCAEKCASPWRTCKQPEDIGPPGASRPN